MVTIGYNCIGNNPKFMGNKSYLVKFLWDFFVWDIDPIIIKFGFLQVRWV